MKNTAIHQLFPSEDGVRLPIHGGVIENGRTRNPLTLFSVPVLVHVQVWVRAHTG